MLEVNIKLGQIIDNVLEIISIEQSNWSKKCIIFDTQRRNSAKKGFEKYFNKLPNNAFYEKTMENVRNRVEVEFNRRDGTEKIVNQQSKLTFNVVHIAYAKYVSHIFKQKRSTYG